MDKIYLAIARKAQNIIRSLNISTKASSGKYIRLVHKKVTSLTH